MTERTFTYAHRDLVALMLRDQGITSGLWHFQTYFGFAAINAGPPDGEMSPTAMVSVQSIGIKETEVAGPLVFDAAQINHVNVSSAGTPVGRKRAALKRTK